MGYYSYDELNALGITKLGTNVRISKKASLYGGENMQFGNDVRVDDFCVLSGKLEFGNNIHITCHCILNGSEEGIYFRDYSTLAYRCTIFTRSDDYLGLTLCNSTIDETYRYKTVKKAVTIGRHGIVGTGSIIFPGANIEEGVSIGAMSLVLTETEPWWIYVGIPAKKLRERSRNVLKEEDRYMLCKNQNVWWEGEK